MNGRLEEYRGARIVMAGSSYLNMVTTSNSKFAEFRNRRKFLMEFAIHFQCTTRTEKRILGYDNAHAIERGKPWDHKHGVRRVFKKPYGQTKPQLVEFESAEALLESFYCDVERILKSLGLSNTVDQVVERDRRTQ